MTVYLLAMELAADTAKSMVISLAMFHQFASAEEASLAVGVGVACCHPISIVGNKGSAWSHASIDSTP